MAEHGRFNLKGMIESLISLEVGENVTIPPHYEAQGEYGQATTLHYLPEGGQFKLRRVQRHEQGVITGDLDGTPHTFWPAELRQREGSVTVFPPRKFSKRGSR